MHNIIRQLSYICTGITTSHYPLDMKKTTALSFSSLLLAGGVAYLAAKLADLDLTFFFHGDDDHQHYC
ncbi:hypothetical protein GCM10022409_03310 [Hymenobacter glaciei]|uniref:Uncharacterized protein n=1 Tax=Hymenobacter glaciei TaxID=877209 RepID=A0ABP7T902_9BACT